MCILNYRLSTQRADKSCTGLAKLSTAAIYVERGRKQGNMKRKSLLNYEFSAKRLSDELFF